MNAVAFEPGLDVVCIDYQTPTDLAEFIDSYYENLPHVAHTLHVGLVQPGPLDKKAAETIELGDLVHEFADNVGYARSVNDIVSRGNREIIAIFNADCVLGPGVLQTCYDALMEHENWGVLGPRQVDENNRLTHGGIFGTPSHPDNPRWMHLDTGESSEINENAVTVSGAAYFVRRHVWEYLTNCPIYAEASNNAPGAFLPTPHFHEETACSYHARAHGWKTVYYGPIKMIHKLGGASPSQPGWAETQMVISREIFRRFCKAHAIEC